MKNKIVYALVYQDGTIFKLKNYYNGELYYDYEKTKNLKPLNLFSCGIYRYYKKNIYKCMNPKLTKHQLNNIIKTCNKI